MDKPPPGSSFGFHDRSDASDGGQRDLSMYGNAVRHGPSSSGPPSSGPHPPASYPPATYPSKTYPPGAHFPGPYFPGPPLPGPSSPGVQWRPGNDNFNPEIGGEHSHTQYNAFIPAEPQVWNTPLTPRTVPMYGGHLNPQSGPSSPERSYHHAAQVPPGPEHQVLAAEHPFPEFERTISIENPSDPSQYHPSVARIQRNREGMPIIQTYDTRPLTRRRQSSLEGSKAQTTLHADFKRITKTKHFFVVGKVFLTLWSEPAGRNADDSGNTDITAGISNGFSQGSFGETVFSEIRRFVVVREGDRHCGALPIVTYTRQGVSKKGVNKSEHTIIYTGKTIPSALPRELPERGEAGMLPQAIRVDPDDPEKKLDPLSRVDFAKVYTIEHNVKVRSLGRVNRDSMQPLLYQFRLVWSKYFQDDEKNLKMQTRQQLRMEEPELQRSSSPAKVLAAYNALRALDLTPEKARATLQNAGCDLSNTNLDDPFLEEGSTAVASDDGGSNRQNLSSASTAVGSAIS